MNGAGWRQRDCVVDIEVFSDYAVEDEKPGDTPAGFGLPDPAGLHLGEMRGGREGVLLALLDRKVPEPRKRIASQKNHMPIGNAPPNKI